MYMYDKLTIFLMPSSQEKPQFLPILHYTENQNMVMMFVTCTVQKYAAMG